MIPSFREIELQAARKQAEEKSAPNNYYDTTSKSFFVGNTNKTASHYSSSSRQWSSSALRNPRIVRVSQSFGGKDRHSKVCTVRGLRDRRIRLSIPTAIQLYDLQERLGLSQPSKVIDWLIDSTKEDIDKLPPLQLPQGSSFGQLILQQSIIGSSNDNNNQIAADPNLPLLFDGERSKYWDYLNAASKARSKEIERDNELNRAEKARWLELINNQNGNNNLQGLRSGYNNNDAQVFAQNFFPVDTASSDHHSPMPDLGTLRYNPLYNQSWDNPTSSTPTLARLGSRGMIITSLQDQPHKNSNLFSASSSSSIMLGDLPPGGLQIFFPPSTSSTLLPTYPPYFTVSDPEADPR